MKKFAENLKALRIEKGLGQKELAEKIGVSNGMVSVWESEKHEPTLTNIIKLCKFFNVTSDFLIGLADY